eukprot:Phypoly_transcript_17193.p1 GENE.Phypoly_transcript_17193~~Phypoly_transcript_17193.p1  ORF type:complete len:254 (+),score=34.39 Phypoly_transcript_17193:80-763(+)
MKPNPFLCTDLFKKEGIPFIWEYNQLHRTVGRGFLRDVKFEACNIYQQSYPMPIKFYLLPNRICEFPHSVAYPEYDRETEKNGALPTLEEMKKLEQDEWNPETELDIDGESDDLDGHDSEDCDYYEYLSDKDVEEDYEEPDDKVEEAMQSRQEGVDRVRDMMNEIMWETIPEDDKNVQQMHKLMHQLLLLVIRKAKELMEFKHQRVMEISHFANAGQLFDIPLRGDF